MIDKLFQNINWLEKGLDVSWLKNRVINNNIANVDTVGFKSSRVEFESEFKAAFDRESFRMHSDFNNDITDIDVKVVENKDTSMRMDGNNVDIDYENAELAKNTIYYNTLIQQISSEFRRLSIVINDSK